MENKLRKLFERQRFEQVSSLDELIAETENRYNSELSDDWLEDIAAAGDFINEKPDDESKPKNQ